MFSCWLAVDQGAIWAFVGPVAGILAVSRPYTLLSITWLPVEWTLELRSEITVLLACEQINVVMFVIAICTMCRHKANSAAWYVKQKPRLERIRSVFHHKDTQQCFASISSEDVLYLRTPCAGHGRRVQRCWLYCWAWLGHSVFCTSTSTHSSLPICSPSSTVYKASSSSSSTVSLTRR